MSFCKLQELRRGVFYKNQTQIPVKAVEMFYAEKGRMDN